MQDLWWCSLMVKLVRSIQNESEHRYAESLEEPDWLSGLHNLTVTYWNCVSQNRARLTLRKHRRWRITEAKVGSQLASVMAVSYSTTINGLLMTTSVLCASWLPWNIFQNWFRNRTGEWPTGTWESAPQDQSWGKCKSKPECHLTPVRRANI